MGFHTACKANAARSDGLEGRGGTDGAVNGPGGCVVVEVGCPKVTAGMGVVFLVNRSPDSRNLDRREGGDQRVSGDEERVLCEGDGGGR